jgi:phage anti-repressor protein
MVTHNFYLYIFKMSSQLVKRLSKVDLVKLFTTIPHSFVDDFYNVLESSNSNTNMFPISLDTLSKWLNVTKGNLFQTLQQSYNEGDDYMLQKEDVRLISGRKKIHVMLTIDAFKRLCMRSRSKKAEDVRTYFIELDNFVTMYTTEILNGLLSKLNKTHRNKDGTGWIYVFRVKHDILKVGYAKDLLLRLRSYNTGRLDDIEILHSFKTSNRKKVEQCVKTFCQAKRLNSRKELFNVDEDIVKRVMQLCVQIGDDSTPKSKWSIKKNGNYYIFINKEELQQ